MKILQFFLALILLSGASFAQATLVTGTITDPNANPYALGTASAFQVVTSGQASTSTSPVPTDVNGLFSMFLPAGTYLFTVCAPPSLLNVPTTNPAPKQVCFTSGPIAISGMTQDVSAALNAIAVTLGPKSQITSGGGGGGGGGNIGNLIPGCIPVATPTGSALPLKCSGFTDNGQSWSTPEPGSGPGFTATIPNTGLDLTGGDGSNLNVKTGHSYLFADIGNFQALHAIYNGADTNSFVQLNPSGPGVHIDGFTFPSTCGYLQSLPINSIVTVYADILENFTCNPYQAVQGLVLQLHLGVHNNLYTSDVPITLVKTNDALVGEIRARSGAAIYRGSGIAPSATYAASNNPWIPVGPTGFTISATTSGCTNFLAAGTYRVGITWGPDFNRETGVNNTPTFTDGWQEQTVTVDGATNCIRVVPPGSPDSRVVRYNVYICHQNGCASGTELWQQQLPIANSFTLNSTSFAVGSGSPPHINTTGAFIAMASESAANASASNVLFGVRVKDLSIDCSQNGLALAATPGCIAIANFNSEEESAIERIDFNEVGGPVDIYVGFNSIGLAASNSAVRIVSLNNGSISNPSVAGVYLDSIETFRGLDDITDTQASVPSCVIAIGSSLQPVSGTSITNGHFEKCAIGINLQSFHGSVNNITCAPTSTTQCVVADINSTVSIHAIRGGSSDAPITDAQTNFTSAKSYECCYEGDLVYKPSLVVGQVPTSCTWTGIGATGTCAFATGSSNAAGKMNLNTSGGGTLALGTFAINFVGNFGVNGGLCFLTAQNQAGIWSPRITFVATAIGTGQFTGLWDNNAVVLTGGTTYAVLYHCDPF